MFYCMQARDCAVQLQRGFGFDTTAEAQEQQLAAKDDTISRLEQEIADLKQKLHPGRLDSCGCIVAPHADCPSSSSLTSANKLIREEELFGDGLSIRIMAEAVESALMPKNTDAQEHLFLCADGQAAHG